MPYAVKRDVVDTDTASLLGEGEFVFGKRG